MLYTYRDDLHLLSVRNGIVTLVTVSSPPNWRDYANGTLMEMAGKTDYEATMGAPVSVRCAQLDVTAEATLDVYGNIVGDEDFLLAAVSLAAQTAGGEVIIGDTKFVLAGADR